MNSRRKCVFCQIASGKLDASFIYQDDEFMVIMDAYPLTEGHLLVIPKNHCQHALELTEAQQQRLYQLGMHALNGLKRAGFGTEGCNVLLNDGKAANQTVPHVHLHIVPRKPNDILRSLPKLFLHVTGLFGIQTKRAILNKQAERIAENCCFD